MELTFGFVSICLSEYRCSPAGNVTVKSVAALDKEAQRHRIRQTAVQNIQNTIRTMHFLRAHDLHLYRISANLIPLATHEITGDWAWWEDEEISQPLVRLGELVREHGCRISSHLPEVCVLSTPKPDVLAWLKRYIRYHRRLYDAMGLDETAKIMIHIGGSYRNPEKALHQAAVNFAALDDWAKERLVLENDDKSFSAAQTICLAQRVQVPMVFDYHHHMVRNDGGDLGELLQQAFATWTDHPPKVHLSSPRSTENPRAHADYVDWDFALPLFTALRALDRSVDIMVEAKQKDLALFRLRDEYMAHFGAEGVH